MIEAEEERERAIRQMVALEDNAPHQAKMPLHPMNGGEPRPPMMQAEMEQQLMSAFGVASPEEAMAIAK